MYMTVCRYTKVCFIKIRSKHSSVTMLCLLRIFMKQTLHTLQFNSKLCFVVFLLFKENASTSKKNKSVSKKSLTVSILQHIQFLISLKKCQGFRRK